MRKILVILSSALLAALLAAAAWIVLFVHFTELTPGTTFPPADWDSLSVDAQIQWSSTHMVRIEGMQALLHVFTNVRDYGPMSLVSPVFGIFGVLFLCALGALGINAFLLNRSSKRWIVGVFAVLVVGVGAAIAAMMLNEPSVMVASGPQWYSNIGGKQLTAMVSESDLAASPSWSPNSPLPLRPEDAILRATEALPRLGTSAAGWSFSDLTLHGEMPGQFFFTVTFRPDRAAQSWRPPSDEFAQIIVYLNGKVSVPHAAK
jgi:hypothetical protein